ncbi:hypothetical protein ScalyP_jg7102 [Parmales sp. scaly parma]|nr:hypothetical protein ScalyP_jg7102 [Parmales sp. scaly parma]
MDSDDEGYREEKGNEEDFVKKKDASKRLASLDEFDMDQFGAAEMTPAKKKAKVAVVVKAKAKAKPAAKAKAKAQASLPKKKKTKKASDAWNGSESEGDDDVTSTISARATRGEEARQNKL